MVMVTIDENALQGMESLLGDQFADTLAFCCAEFERLSAEILATINSDVETAARHAHSLKSNAAQFGAISLSHVAREIENSLNNKQSDVAIAAAASLEEQVIASKDKLTQWLDTH